MASPGPKGDAQQPQSPIRIPMNNPFANPSLDDPSTDSVTADWSQWMRWDEFDVEDSNPLDLSISPTTDKAAPSEQNQTMDPAVFSLPSNNAPFSFTSGSSLGDSLSPQEQPCLSDISPSPSDFFDTAFGPVLGTPQGNNTAPVMPSPVNRKNSAPLATKPPVSFAPMSTIQTDRKRKLRPEDTPDTSAANRDMSPPTSKSLPSKKRSHNVIEKRYRANLNDKIAELRDSVPSLRAIAKQRNGLSGQGNDDDDLISSSNKLNKASILSKATEYIRHLEQRNKRLEEENVDLKNRLRQVDKAQEQNMTSYGSINGSASSPGGYTVSTDSGSGSSPAVFSQPEEFSPESSPNPLYPPEGLIKVPEYLKRMRMTGPQPHYADSHIQQRPNNNLTYASTGRRAMPNKFMLGTLAALMVVGGFENQRKSESTEKGLMAIPLQAGNYIYRFARMNFHALSTSSWQFRALLHFGVTSFLVFGAAFAVFLYLFNSAPRRTKTPSKTASAANPLRASTIEFRREAWLTSIQTVWVPSHTFFPEWFAVTWRTLEYVLSCLLGWKLYSYLTGITEDDEKARAKAWDIAIDAQLTGGDPEVSKSRMVLTIFASGTLPSTPARVMLKALHVRLLLWRVGYSGSLACRLSNAAAGILARYQWELARNHQKALPKDHDDALPSHLATLLEANVDHVMSNAIIQRASNMAWNRSTQEATYGEDSMLDVVVEDTAVRSPLDAVAAWFSSRALQNALIHCLDVDATEPCKNSSKTFEQGLKLALDSAPIASAAYTRAAVIKAVFFDEDRVSNINSVLAALPRSKNQPAISSTNFLDSSVPPSARAEISIAVRCAMIAAILKGQAGTDPSTSSQLTLHNAITLFNILPVDPVELTILGFASLYHLLHVIAAEESLLTNASLSSSICTTSSDLSSTPTTQLSDHTLDTASTTTSTSTSLPTPDLRRIALGLTYWVRNAYNPISSGFNSDSVEKAVQGCIDACGRVGIQLDLVETEWEEYRSKQEEDESTVAPATTLSGEETTPVGSNNKDGHSRRESLKSTDTGYGSLENLGDEGD
ncbi:hypothetical protein FQN55_004547 [Onygenales sp. PD_40]|nr:hypothetical protein FQN55_004547 [Onygenales sp. PD_40]KAK2760530.1 hypothetical protein FQN53_007861 [Emmonsiellopsis sp. PD_33]KAK2802198.1 hypothetical protein FQN51_004880 [Onygenales sp. PD_10]